MQTLRLTFLILISLAPASSHGGSGSDARWAIPADQGAAVFALLPPEGGVLPPTGYRITDVEIRGAIVEIRVAGPEGSRRSVTLAHPSQTATVRTRHFAVQAPPADAALAQAVATYIAAHETATPPWRELTRNTPPATGRHFGAIFVAAGALVVLALVIVVVLLLRARATDGATGGGPPSA